MEDNKTQQLRTLLMDQLLRDLHDPDKCTPGLYQVIRGLINDNKDEAGKIPAEALEAVTEALNKAAPFKFKKAVI